MYPPNISSFLNVCMPIFRQADALILCFYHLTYSDHIRQSKEHGQLTVIFSHTSIARFGEPELTFNDSKRMLSLGSHTGFHVLNVDQNFVDSWVLLKGNPPIFNRR